MFIHHINTPVLGEEIMPGAFKHTGLLLDRFSLWKDLIKEYTCTGSHCKAATHNDVQWAEAANLKRPQITKNQDDVQCDYQ